MRKSPEFWRKKALPIYLKFKRHNTIFENMPNADLLKLGMVFEQVSMTNILILFCVLKILHNKSALK